MMVLATAATVIASQAVITGAFSITSQAIQLGLLPRLEIRHTSETQAGQIYIPRVNGFLLVGVLFLVGLFRSSGALASAYGIAVTRDDGGDRPDGLHRHLAGWKWPLWRRGGADRALPLHRLHLPHGQLAQGSEGGWVPLLIGGFLIIVMLTWRRGAHILAGKTRRLETPLDAHRALEKSPPHRVPGTAVFLTADPKAHPPRCCTASSTTRCCTRTMSS